MTPDTAYGALIGQAKLDTGSGGDHHIVAHLRTGYWQVVGVEIVDRHPASAAFGLYTVTLPVNVPVLATTGKTTVDDAPNAV